MNTIEVRNVPVEEIDPSPFQRRKEFPEDALQGLASSIVIHGVMQPALGRLVNGRVELIAGERRLRGTKIAGVPTLPVIVREITDTEANELVVIENLQREDLDILEESEGYNDMLRLKDAEGKSLYTVERLASRLGKDPVYIYQRIKLQALPDVAKMALRMDQISFSVARLLAQVPGEKLRLKATKEVLNPQFEEQPLNARRTAELLRKNYMRELKGAPFDQKDPDLVKEMGNSETARCGGGACTDCPFRTGNNPEEFGEISGGGGRAGGTRGDICTHLECFNLKCDASWEEKKSASLKEGKRVLSEKESDKLFPQNDNRLEYSSPYVVVADKVPRSMLADPNQKKQPSWEKLIEGAESKPEIVVVRAPSGDVLELVDRRQAEAAVKLAAKKRGVEPVLKASRSGEGGSTANDYERKEREKKKLTIAQAHAGVSALVKAMANQGLVDGFWPALLAIAWPHSGADGSWMIGKRLGVESTKQSGSGRDYDEPVQALWEADVAQPALMAAHVVEVLMAQSIKWNGLDNSNFKLFADLYKVDLKEVEKGVKDAINQKKKGKSSDAEVFIIPGDGVNAAVITWNPKDKLFKIKHVKGIPEGTPRVGFCQGWNHASQGKFELPPRGPVRVAYDLAREQQAKRDLPNMRVLLAEEEAIAA